MTTMRAHLLPLKAALPGVVHLFAPLPGSVPDWLCLEAPGWGVDPDGALCADWEPFQADLRVRAVCTSADAADALLSDARAILPGLYKIPGRRFEVRFTRSEVLFVDTDVTLPNNRHPGVGVDTYTLTSQPIKE